MNAKQEIHEILRRCVRYARPFTAEEEDKVRAILETHELVLVDMRPFDPTLCGFAIANNHTTNDLTEWRNDSWRILREKHHDRFLIHVWCVVGLKTTYVADGPWPATQSDGETLLRLLGVLEK